MRWLTLVAVLAALLVPVASASASHTYTLEQSTDELVPGEDDIGLYDDDEVVEIDTPFPVTVYGTQYSSVVVGTNANLQFGVEEGDANDDYEPDCLPDSAYERTLFVYGDDMVTDGDKDQGIFTKVDGEPGHRRFIIEWRAGYYDLSEDARAYFEAIFYEDSPRITTIYGDLDEEGEPTAIGIQASSTGPFTSLLCDDEKDATQPASGARVDYVPHDDNPPSSAASVPACSSDGRIAVKVDDVEYGDKGPKAVHYRLDGGAEQVAATDADGNAVIETPDGSHSLEYWGEDNEGNLEAERHTATVVADRARGCAPAPAAGPPAPATDAARPSVRVAGVRRACVSRSFKVRITVRDGSPLASVRVSVDGKRVTGTKKSRFTVRVPLRRLKAGRHRLTIVAVDAAGNRRTVTRRFVRCAQAQPRRRAAPRFTG